ncbi:MAG: acyltransferase [Acidimicrobiales bacterium]
MRKVLAWRWAVRRWVFLVRLQLKARALGASVDAKVAAGVRIWPGVRFDVLPGSANRVVIGSGCRIHDGVLVHLKGGRLDLGDGVEIRRGSILNLSGTFRCEGHNIISYANVIHCAQEITLAPYASTNEFVSIIDSTHHHDGDHGFFYENVTTAPIHIGANAWICNKASVLMGVSVGSNAVVASHAVVNRDVPEAAVVGGVPARLLAERQVGVAARTLVAGS